MKRKCFRTLRRGLFVLLLWALGATPADAATNLLAYDGFSTFDYTVGALLNQNPSRQGFTNAWQGGNNIHVGGTNFALTYPDLATDDSGGAFNAALSNRSQRDLNPTLSGTATYYVSVLLRNSLVASSYRSLEFWNFGERNIQLGANGDIDGTGQAWGIRVLDSTTYRIASSVQVEPGQTVLAVLRVSFSTESNGDAVRLWVNPVDVASEAASTNFVELSGFNFNGNAITRVAYGAWSGTSTGTWDELRIGTTWASVLPAPQAPTFGVIYEVNGLTAGEPPVDSARYEEGAMVTVLANTGGLSRVGYSFEGWDTLPEGTGVRYAGGETFTMGYENVTLYAAWERLPQPTGTYIVVYHGNGNTGGHPTEDLTYYEPGATVTVASAATLVRSGWAFDGWNTQADGEGTLYQPDDALSMGPDDVDLYAVWRLNPSTGQHVRVFVLAGQSNMRGSGTVRQAPGEWRPLQGVLFDETTPNDPASYSADWEQLGLDVDHMGPEMSFAATLREAYTNERIAIVKVSQSGTGIGYWKSPGELGHDTLMARIGVATNRLNTLVAANAIPSWSFGGFLWMQGENEANSIESVALAYATDFDVVATRVREKTGVTNLPVVLARISIQLDPALGGPVNQPQLDYVRAGQVAWATNDTMGGWVHTDDLTLIDSWHFGSVGQLGLGKRFAAAWFGVAEPRPALALRRSSGQTNRTNGTSVQYDALFSDAVTGFDAEDVIVLGDTGADQVSVMAIAPFDGTSYRITVAGMQVPGVVDIRVPNAAAQAGGLDSLPGIYEETAIVYAPHPGVADLIAYEPFDATLRPLSRLGSGAGWSGAGWEIQNNVTNGYSTATNNPLAYTNLSMSRAYGFGGDTYSTSARALDLEKTFAGYMTSRGAGALDVPGTTLWLSYVIRPNNVGQRQRLALMRGTETTYNDANNMVRIEQAGGFWQMVAMNNATSNNTGVAVQSGSNYLMVLRLHIGGAAAASSSHLWINPSAETLGGTAPDLATATTSISLTHTNFTFGRFHWYPGGTFNDGAIDEIRLGTTFASVTPVPVGQEGEPDADNDGLPNWWEEQFFGGPTNATASALAANGVNTVLEGFIAGLDPTDPEASFEMSGQSSALDTLVLQWPAVTGRLVNLYRSTNLINGVFVPLAGPLAWPQAAYTTDQQQVEGEAYFRLDIRLE